MNLRLPLLAAALVSLLLSSPASAGTHTNLFENFSTIDADWGAKADTYKLLNGATEETAFSGTDVSGWTGTGLIFKAPSCIRLGNSGTKGVAISPVIRLSDKAITAGSATLSFHAAKAASTVGVNTAANVTVLNSDGTPADGISVYAPKHLVDCSAMANIDSCYTNTDGIVIQNVYTGLPNEFRLQFESSASSDGRVAIDAVLVIQDIRDTLSAPANLALSGTAGANDFIVTWGASANAQGYSVKLLDANDGVVSSNDVAAVTTSASFTGLTSSSAYTVVVVALGNHTTTDDSVAATLPVTTAASSAAAPTLDVSVTSWTAGVAGTSAVSATLEGGVDCMVASVSMSDGSSATVANGVLSWMPPAANAASSVTATFHVTHGNDGWDIPQVLSVAATPAPSAPAITLSNASRSSFDASWSASAGGPVVEYKVRAWTGRETPDDATGTLTELFSSWYSNKQLPAGWSKNGNLGQYKSAVGVHFPIQFNSSGQFLVSPVYIGNPTSLSFTAKNNSIGDGSLFTIFGSDGNPESEFKVVESFDATSFSNDTAGGVVTINLSADYRQFKFEYTSTSGNLGFGSFVVSGTDWPAADFLEGWGGAKVSVGTATSQTISNPVAGEVNWVEVTAVGPSGLETSARASISVPRVPAAVISVK